MWYIYTMDYYSATEKDEMMPLAARWMNLEIVLLTELSQIEKKKYPRTSLICRIEKRNDTNELIYKTEAHSQTREPTYGCQQGGWRMG